MRVPVDSPRRQRVLADANDNNETDNDRDLIERLAVRLQQMRNERQLTLDQLARISGVSRTMLWQVEQGRSAPTIKVLSRVAEALAVPVSAFLESAARAAPVVLRRAEAKFLSSSDGRSCSRALFPYIGVHDVEFYELKLEEAGEECAEPHPSGTDENLVVVRGRVEIEVSEDRVVLETGDALYFKADVRHVYRNLGTAPALLYLVVTHPSRLNYG